MTGDTLSDVRPSPIAGQWYPGHPQELARTVDALLADAPTIDVPGRVLGLVVPHAGYVYSGPIAARAFKLVDGLEVDRVVVVGPMHRPHSGSLLTTAHAAYETPLGLIPVDNDTLAAIDQQMPVTRVPRDSEHALEIELPFLQRTLAGEFSLVPLMMRDQSYEAARQLGEAIAGALGSGERSLLVASSDLSHFYTDAQARELDQIMLDRVADFDPPGVIRAEQRGEALACGRGAITAVLIAARALGADNVRIVGYGTSADASGDESRVVGYGAAVITQAGG